MLSLYEASRCEPDLCPRLLTEVGEQGAESFDRHARVLVVPDHVLEPGGGFDDTSHGFTAERSGEFGGVAETFHPDAHGV